MNTSNIVSSSSSHYQGESEPQQQQHEGEGPSSDLPYQAIHEPPSHHSDSTSSDASRPAKPSYTCTICGDLSFGRHYGVVSCEGCKGFFKRTVRKNQTYYCRDGKKQCIVDLRLRNRCQHCRFQKCIVAGMRQEVVQQYRMRSHRRAEHQTRPRQVASLVSLPFALNPPQPRPDTTVASPQPPLQFCMRKLQDADALFVSGALPSTPDFQTVPMDFRMTMTALLDVSSRQLVDTCEKELLLAARYVRSCPFIAELPMDDQLALVKCAWNELHLSAMASRARYSKVQQALLLSSGMSITSAEAPLFGLGGLVDRVCNELLSKIIDLKIDKFEMSCLRAVVLFNPDANGLVNVEKIEACRGVIYSALELHCYQKHPEDKTRFAKLLLRLPSLRSISLKCTSQLFFSQLFPTLPFESIFVRLLGPQQPPQDLRLIAMDVEREDYYRRMNTIFGPNAIGRGLGGTMIHPWGGVSGMPQSQFAPQPMTDEVSSSGAGGATFSSHSGQSANFNGHSSDSDVNREPMSHDEPFS